MSGDEREYLKQLHRHASETRRLFSNAGKPERKRMICRAMLRCLGMKFDEEELMIGPSEPIDVSFREARFQITEAMEPGRRRNDVWRERENRYRTATTVADVIEPHVPPRRVAPDECVNVVAEQLQRKAMRYGRALSDIDGLVHMSLHNSYLYPTEPWPTTDEFRQWRSVSVIFVPYATVLFATDAAPAWLRSAQGKTHMKWPAADGWYDA